MTERVYVESVIGNIEVEPNGHVFISLDANKNEEIIEWDDACPQLQEEICKFSEDLNKLCERLEKSIRQCQCSTSTSS